jgi:hypothetical protein
MTSRQASRHVALVAALATSASGCSWLTMRDAPPRNQMRFEVEPDCSDGRGAPVADLVASGLSAFTGLMLIALVSAFDNGDGDADEAYLYSALFFGTPTILFGVSASSGFSSARRCRAAIEEWYTMRAQMQFGPPPTYQPPPEAPPAPAGVERGRCRLTVPACDPGLACASGFCVRPP